MSRSWRSKLVGALAAWLVASVSLVTVVTRGHPVMHAILCMSWGVILLWIAVAGGAMYLLRDRARALTGRIPAPPLAVFTAFSLALLGLEEAVTTTMTNLAPLFGVEVGRAYITASTDYLDVVGLHSGPPVGALLVGWAFVLRRWAFSPFAVFLMFGLTGYVAELFFMGFSPDKIGTFAFWIFVYGLMVWLPAYCLPAERGAAPPPVWSYAAAPFLAVLAALPLLAAAGFLINSVLKHPQVHFPPIVPGGG